MSRVKIVMMLYVLTFLMSAYIKFTRPEKFEANLEIYRQGDMVNPSHESLKYMWYSDQNRAQFRYQLYKQIGVTLNSENFTERGSHRFIFDSFSGNWISESINTPGNQTRYELYFDGNLDDFRILTLDKSETLTPTIPATRNVKFSEKDFNNIQVFRKVPFKNGPIVINFHEPINTQQENNNYIYDKYKLKLADSTLVKTADAVIFSKNPAFEVLFDMSEEDSDVKGNYLEMIEETKNVTSERLSYFPKIFSLNPLDVQSFQITYPPDNFVEETQIPVGIPYKQTIIANQTIDRFQIRIGNRDYAEIDIRNEPEDVIREDGTLKYKCHDNKTTLDLFFPIYGDGDEVNVTITAHSGLETTSKTWPIKIMGLRFSSWPPIKPKKWTAPEQELYQAFLRQFKDQQSYMAASVQERKRFPLVYESRSIIVLPHFQNVDFKTYRNYQVSFPEASSANITRSGNAMKQEIETIPRDITQLRFSVNTEFGDKDIVFYVKQVREKGSEAFIKRCNVVNNPVSGTTNEYRIYVECINFFDESIKINKEDLETADNLYFDEKGYNLFSTRTEVRSTRLNLHFNLDYFGRTREVRELEFN